MNGRGGAHIHITFFVYGFTQDIEDAAQGGSANRDADGRSSIDNFHAPYQAIGRAHCHSSHLGITQQLLYLTGNRDICPSGVFARNL